MKHRRTTHDAQHAVLCNPMQYVCVERGSRDVFVSARERKGGSDRENRNERLTILQLLYPLCLNFAVILLHIEFIKPFKTRKPIHTYVVTNECLNTIAYDDFFIFVRSGIIVVIILHYLCR